MKLLLPRMQTVEGRSIHGNERFKMTRVLLRCFRSGADHSDFGCPFVSLIEMIVGAFSANKLPVDLMAVTAKPGSR